MVNHEEFLIGKYNHIYGFEIQIDEFVLTTYPKNPDGLPKIKPLPVLKVIRETYCSQKDIDEIISYLEKRMPENLYLCMVDETPVPHVKDKAYGNLISRLVDEAPQNIPLPKTDTGLVDLVYEISRRIRSAYNLPEVQVLGKSLARNIEGDYLPLVSRPAEIETDNVAFGQVEIDTAMEKFYQENKSLCFAVSEAMRRTHRLHSLDGKLNAGMQKIIEREFHSSPLAMNTNKLNEFKRSAVSELRKRLRIMCFLPL